ncbi:MAG: hypothetical protein JXA22_05980 [Candidatus Thermoplasmatota archaeon]|nr:hypothetical protein [Candidatus Thermoplasmatota archaeon]
MPKEEKVCPKCAGKMELGELIDESYAVSVAQKWAKHAEGILGLGRSEGIPILSYRCVECGFLENYAPSKAVETNGDELPFGYNR